MDLVSRRLVCHVKVFVNARTACVFTQKARRNAGK